MFRKLLTLTAFGALTVFATAPAQAAEGDPEAGKQIFNQCRACHALEEGQHRVGPSLHGVFGREAGGLESFKRYSKALQESDIVWNEETIGKYLADPSGYIPGNIMSYPGLKSEEKRADVIAYLKQATQ